MNKRQIQKISDTIPVIHKSKKPKLNIIAGIDNIKFDNEQKMFITDELKDSKVYGLPGSGKSYTLFYKIINLYNKDIITRNDEFLILTYNKRINTELLIRAKDINKKYFTESNIKTFYSVSGIINKNLLNKSNPLSRFTSILGAYDSLYKSDIVDIYNIKILQNLKCIFVDDAQELTLEQFNLIVLIKNIVKCKIIMLGDINQNIYDNECNTNYFLNYNVPTYNFNQNYRNNPNILNFYKNFVLNNSCIEPVVKNNNNKVTVYNCDIDKDFETILLDEITKSGIKYHDIAIISPCRKSGENNNCIGLNSALNILIKNNIRVNINYSVDHTNSNDDKFIIKNDAINLFTIHTSKGLEFKKVILLNFHLNTFGFAPSLKDYNFYKKLWYIGCSRAKDYLSIFINKDKYVFPEFFNIQTNSYNLILAENTYVKRYYFHKFKEEKLLYNKSVTNVITNCKNTDLLKMEELIKFNYYKENIYECDNIHLLDYDIYKMLYGSLLENIIQYYYEYNNLLSKNIFTTTKEHISNMYILDNIHSATFNSIKRKFSLNINKKIYLADIYKFTALCNNVEIELLNNIEKFIIDKKTTFIYLSINNDIYDKYHEGIENICDTMISDIGNIYYLENIFKITLFYYSLENELEFLLSKNFANHLNELFPLVEKIKTFIYTQSHKTLEFQKDCNHPNINIPGRIDIYDASNNEIIEIKCCESFDASHVYQLLLYYNNLFPKWDVEKKLTIWNVLKGDVYTITVDHIDPFKFLCVLSDMSGLKLNNISICYDLETTGLDRETCNIIDICCIEYNLGFEIINTLVNPDEKIPVEVVKLTHITDDMVQTQGIKSLDFYKKFKDIMSYFNKPKFIAHNGNYYDHPIMKRLKLFPDTFKHDIELFDSKNIINVLIKDKKSLKLTELYKDIFNVIIIPYDAHNAQPDVLMMIAILKRLNFKF